MNHGLRFNPNKTKCIINGKNPFIKDPKWYIDESELEVVEYINFLGCVLGNNSSALFKSGLSHFYSFEKNTENCLDFIRNILQIFCGSKYLMYRSCS